MPKRKRKNQNDSFSPGLSKSEADGSRYAESSSKERPSKLPIHCEKGNSTNQDSYHHIKSEPDYTLSDVGWAGIQRGTLERKSEVQAMPERKFPSKVDSVDAKIAFRDELSSEDRLYFLAIKVDLEGMVSRSAKKSNGDANELVDDEVLDSIWDRIEGKEIALSRDKTLSFILEHLLLLTGASGALRLMTLLSKYAENDPHLLSQLCSHSCSSHVLEAIFETVARIGKPTKQLNRSLKHFLRALLNNPEIFLQSTYAAHIAEKMLLRLAGILRARISDDGILYDFVSQTDNADDLVLEPVTISYAGNDKQYSAQLSEFLKEREHALDKTNLLLAWDGIMEFLTMDSACLPQICTSSIGTVIVQALLFVSIPVSLLCREDAKDVERNLDDLLGKFVSIFDEISLDKYGSRIAELVIAALGRIAFENLVGKISAGQEVLDRLVRDHYAHHTIIRMVMSCSSVALLCEMCKAVSANCAGILESGHGMLLVKLAQILSNSATKQRLCRSSEDEKQWYQCQDVFSKALNSFYSSSISASWAVHEKTAAVLVCTGALYPKNIREHIESTIENTSMPGSQILQALCSFKDPSLITQGFLKMDVQLLLQLCCNACGSHTIETVIQTQNNRKGFSQPFLKKLVSIIPKLVLDKHGSRVFDVIWKTGDMKCRESVADVLISVESTMKKNEFGRFLLPKLNLGLYKRSIEAWRREQLKFQSQKDELNSILDLINKKP
ncbi:nucleolar protein 9-like [Paramacrobiotus metropolitanus]|uniref:nucleolar protein 9-like n=1 Tax=Paramacrobiotus metropolitanus TaxID=2943436 RepID=UPI0024465683|nr:nucleolar protein 9-like [Paramacrobiotus metropolitanus]XP_055327685.1 nucleolar protein 9-like [Paramacrobiotus metropolitanus]